MAQQAADHERRLFLEREAARALLAEVRDDIGDDEALLVTTIEGETGVGEAIDAALGRLIELKGLGEGIKDVLATVRSRLDRIEAQQQRIEAAIARTVAELALERFERKLATVGTAKVPDKVEISDESEIPESYFRQPEPEIDRALLRAALRDQEQRRLGLIDAMIGEGMSESDARAEAERVIAADGIKGAALVPQPRRLNVRWR